MSRARTSPRWCAPSINFCAAAPTSSFSARSTPDRYDPGPDANVHFPGYVSDAEKFAYFRGARGVVFASLSEGFGIPIVEGAVMGLPVLCSDIEVFREVAGEDAYLFRSARARLACPRRERDARRPASG